MFKAIYLTKTESGTTAQLADLSDDQLPVGDVTVRVEYSSLNFKDALAITGRGAIVRKWPMVAGVDLAGVVESSESPNWIPGDRVLVNCWGLSETHWGGLSQKARLPSNWLLKLPSEFDSRLAMAIGTAGYTAALCVRALLKHGLKCDGGPVLVTGASGGVGSIAIAVLAELGFEVVAATGRASEADYLRSLGAHQVIERAELAQPGKALQSERWAGAVDTLGSNTLANICASTKWGGAVAACGLAQGHDLPVTVMPFILRGITLYGINCVLVPNEDRADAYHLLANYLPKEKLSGMINDIGLTEAISSAGALLDGKLHGRTVVDVAR